MIKKLLSWSAVAFMSAAILSPISANAAETCVAGECTLEFSHTGSVQTFVTPAGASNLRFEVYGAAGARGGGGGSVIGELVNPASTLFIYVGGAGQTGSGAAGGFNGGGNAGGNRGNEGSGGGASDIRTATNLESRIVVAGGGGGGGGYSGAAGAPGGGLIADNGGSGQGSGGGGGSQTSGGFNGASNGGSPSSAGSYGFGGNGGSSWNAGGGGGGGGWYGGGGGGGDDDDCCSDGGGGGGGSSYAQEAVTSGVSHQKGVQAGHGKIVIRYTLRPTVTGSTASQLSSSVAVFDYEFSMQLVGLSASDFTFSQECEFGQLETTDYTAQLTLLDCADGLVFATLAADSVGLDVTGPEQSMTVELQFDALGPVITWQQQHFVTSQSSALLALNLGDNLSTITSASFTVSGCNHFEYLTEPEPAISVSDCVAGLVEVVFLAGSASDQWGNLAPENDLATSFTVDQSGPNILQQAVVVAGDGPFTYSWQLTFDEVTSFSSESVAFTSSEVCLTSSAAVTTGWLFEAVCDYATGSWTIPANSAVDEVGNLGPTVAVVAAFENPRPAPPAQVAVAPAPESSPQPEPVPATPQPVIPDLPIIEPEPEEALPVVESESGEVTASELVVEDTATGAEVIELPNVVAEAIAPSENDDLPEATDPEPEQDQLQARPQVVTASATPTQSEVEIIPVAGPKLEPEPAGEIPWWPLAALLAVIALGVGVWRFSGK